MTTENGDRPIGSKMTVTQLVEAIKNAPVGSDEKWALIEQLSPRPRPEDNEQTDYDEDKRGFLITMGMGGIVLATAWFLRKLPSPAPETSSQTAPSATATTNPSKIILPQSYHQVEDYIQNYRRADILGNSLENQQREWQVFTASRFAKLNVKTDMGIWVHNFPNKDASSSRSVPTYGPPTGPTYYAWYWGHDIPGEYSTYVTEYNKKTRDISIWAARFVQNQAQFWRVYSTEDKNDPAGPWYTTIKIGDKIVSGESYLAATLPYSIFTTRGGILVDPHTR